MEIIIEGSLKKLVPTEKQYLLAKTDIDKEEKERNYFTFAYIPDSVTIEDCEYIYMEVDKGDDTPFLHLTRGDVFRGLLQAKGIKREQIRSLIEAMPETTEEERLAKELALIDFDEALNFYRGVDLIDELGEHFGITPEQMTQFFRTNDYHALIGE